MKQIEKKEKRKTKEPRYNAMLGVTDSWRNAMLNEIASWSNAMCYAKTNYEVVSWSNAMINETMNKQVCYKMAGVRE